MRQASSPTRLADGSFVRITPFDERAHSIPEMTWLLHRAYARLAAMGFKFLATHQDDAMTLRRLREGECFVAEMEGRVVGTVTWYRAGKESKSPCEYYRRPDVASFGQFAVEPALQGKGIGNLLRRRVEERVSEAGIAHLALDTAEGAMHLIDHYARHGYRVVGHVQWDVTNYRSVVMSKALEGRTGTGRI